MTKPPHDLASFLAQETNRLAEEYERMTPRVAEDPGTAGDQGEENWAVILRKCFRRISTSLPRAG